MSEASPDTVQCKQCGQSTPVTIWQSINATQDPELKERLLSGELFRVICAQCGHEMYLLYELLYHDMEKRFMAWLRKPRPDGEMPSELQSTGEQAFQGYRLRIVTSMNELLEKIYIFDSGLDDRVIEALKASLRKAEPDQAAPDPNSLLFSHLESDDDGQPKNLIFLYQPPEGESLGLSVPLATTYYQVMQWLYDHMGVPATEVLARWQQVDNTYLPGLMEAHN